MWCHKNRIKHFHLFLSFLYLGWLGRRIFGSQLVLPFFSFYETAHNESDDAYADAGLEAEHKTFYFTGKFAAKESFQNGGEPGFIVLLGYFGYHFSAGIVRTAEFGTLQCKKRYQSDQETGKNQSDN